MRLINADVFINNIVKYSHQSTKTIGQALADTPTVKAVPIEKIHNLINDIEVLRTDPTIIDNDDVQRFAENVLYALNNLIKEGK